MTDIQSLLFYIFFFLLAGLFMGAGLKRKFKPFIALGLIIPVVISGLRYDVGTDYRTYIDSISLFDDVGVTSYINDFSSYLEPSFYILANIAHYFNFPHLVFFVYSFISVIFLYKTMKVSSIKYVGLVYSLMLLIIFPISFNLVRQFAAISIASYATAQLFNGNKKKYYLYTIIASLFHVSALINVASLIVYRRINSSKKRTISLYKLIFGIIMISITVSLSVYGLQKYGYLFEMENATANLNFVPRLLMLLAILTLWHSSRVAYRKYRLFIDLGVLCIILGLVGFFVPYGDRLALYFMPFIILLFPTAIYELMPKSKKHLTLFIVLVVGLLYFIVSYYILGSHSVIPYRTIFEVSV